MSTDKATPMHNLATKLEPMKRIRRVHFVGCGGSGMGGIAEVMVNLKYEVSGSDLSLNAVSQRLQSMGATIYQGHDAKYVKGCDVVVASTAIKPSNPELVAARELRIPVVPRAEMLAELMRFQFGIAISGTHGKTTTTSLVASVLAEAGLDPTFVIGGRLNSTASNARLGKSEYLVAEADESDASFLYLQPVFAVVTNIDADHLGTYDGDFEKLRQTFMEFLHHLPFYGLAVMCVDDPEVRRLLPEVTRPIRTYGFSEDAEVRASHLVTRGTVSHFDLHLPGSDSAIPMSVNLPGEHNVQNALAAIAVAHELGVGDEDIARALNQFQGIGRRFQLYGDCRLGKRDKEVSVTLVDDYGHHPTEVGATLAAARQVWPGRRLVVAFQPHRYSRTRDLFEDFVRELSACDCLLLCEVFAAGETPIAGADGRALARAIRSRGHVEPVFVDPVDDLPLILSDVLEDGDVLMTLGAGSIGGIADRLFNESDKLRQIKSNGDKSDA